MAHFYMDGVQLPQDWSHFEKAVYFLPLSSQKFQEHLIKVFPFFLHPLCPMWVQSGTFICPIIVLNLNISFYFCDMLGFNVIWFVKCMQIRKLKIEIISIQHNSLTQCTAKFLYQVIQGVLKLFALNLILTHSFNFFIITKRISDWHCFCK